MLFAVMCWDKADQQQVRLATRPAHLAYLAQIKERLKLAGPFLGPDGQTSIGSLMIYECPDETAARATIDNDPFTKAGLFASVEVKAWRQGAGTPLG